MKHLRISNEAIFKRTLKKTTDGKKYVKNNGLRRKK